MSIPESNQLTEVEKLFDAGKLDEALELLSDSSKFLMHDFQQKEYFQCLKSLILIYLNKSEEVIKLGEEIFKEGQKYDDHVQSFDGFLFNITGLGLAGKFDEAFKLSEKAEALLNLLSNENKKVLLQRKIRLSLLKAWINLNIGNMETAEKWLEWIINFEGELENTFEIVWANILMVQIVLKIKGNPDLAMEYNKKAISIATEIKYNHYWIALSYLYFGRIYLDIAEFDISLDYYMKSLNIFRTTNNTFWMARVLCSVGALYGYKGVYDKALASLEESLLLYEMQSTGIEFCLDNLVSVTLEKGDIESAQKYFLRLENIYHEKKKGHIEIIYLYDKALMLKASPRLRDKIKAEELFKQVIETKTIFTEIIEDACIHLCDLLLAEYHMTNDNDVLNEINHYIAKLLTIVESSKAYQCFCETFMLQSKLSLLKYDLKAAQRFLTQAQKIAESHGIIKLSIKISNEHDELLKQVKIWKVLKESDASLSQRWELAGLNEQISIMIRKHLGDIQEVSDEQPVLLLIVSEGGVPFFSQSFIEDKIFEDYLFGGFFSAINSFINEKFSEGLDRASFGNYTLIMDSISPFLMCYVYQGQSYFAQKRIKSFINELKNNKELWDIFENFYHANRKIQIRDIPSLEPVITKIFIDKTIDV